MIVIGYNGGMTLTELRYLLALSQEMHFGRAAERCHVSQPTLSVAINRLETSLGVTIFERDKNNLRVTEPGERIIQQAQRVLEEADTLKDIAESGKHQLDTPLRVGGIYTIAPYLFPQIIPTLKQRAPNMPLVIQEDFTKNLRVKLLHGELDAIFVAMPFSEPGVVTRQLYDEPFVALLPKAHPLAKQQKINPAAMAKEDVLLLGEGHCFKDQVLNTCPGCYKSDGTQHVVEGASLETLRAMVASGMGITVLPSTATQVKHYGQTLTVKCFSTRTPHRTVALAWRVSYPRMQAIEALLQAIADSNMDRICVTPYV